MGDAGSLAMEPTLLMVLITKFFSRVKFVRPTLSELSMTNTMSSAPQRFSQSGTRAEQSGERVGELSGDETVFDLAMMVFFCFFPHHNNHTSPSCMS